MDKIEIPKQALRAFCEKWNITTLELFGSVLSDAFSKTSDVDVMVTFSPDSVPGLSFVEMKEELEHIFGRSVDLVTRKAIEKSTNPYRKESILSTARIIYDKEAA